MLVGIALAASLSYGLRSQSLASASFTPEQATAGRQTYTKNCASCHGEHLSDGAFAPPLTGHQFKNTWAGKPLTDLMQKLRTMPPAAPLEPDQYVDVLAFLLQRNQVAHGTKPLPSDMVALGSLMFLGAADSGSGISAGVALPPRPVPANPLDHFTPVTDAMLVDPPPGDWLTWRRAASAQGFSPLKDISKTNVANLREVWSWSLPPGPNEVTPLAHDGVLFVGGWGDKVQALDGATGDLLWQYSRWLPKGVRPGLKKALALGGSKVFVPTSDAHLVALDVKTGRVLWDTPIADPKDHEINGGPLVAKGKVIVGTRGEAKGGNVIAGLDAETGKVAWRFITVAHTGQPGGDTWNGMPDEQRTGGGIWTPGSYDPTLNLVFFGPSPTYDTAPLRNRITNNDAEYTNATIALNPDTGKLVWFFQHRANDQWDLDWAFERTIVDLPVNGAAKRMIVTGGKEAIFDVVEADSGKYVYSMDLGLQNIVTKIDPKTGAKTIDPSRVPGDGQTHFICPFTVGGKNWLPSAYNPGSKLLFIPLFESCADYVPVGPGERGVLSTGIQLQLRPRPDSDGKYGRLEAINLETRKIAWVARQYSPRTSGVLATASGVLFAGSLDRVFAAYDDATGKELWRTRLNDVPSNAAITYTAGGRQFVAVVVGAGGHQTNIVAPMVPDIRNPPDHGAAVRVFALPSSADRP
jgi:alcohol dehydrogenase (cytochrome c)